jgi:polysaccharide biosynthesis/export protein
MLVKVEFVISAILLVAMLDVPVAIGADGEKHDSVPGNPVQSANQKSAGEAKGTAGSPGSNASVDSDFIIGPDDVLAVNVWREPEVSQMVTVRPDGKISLPLAGQVVASGLTTVQLQEAIRKQLQGFLSRPEVTVIVHQVKSQRVVVAGEVAKPGSYELQSPMTVLDAIAEAGGPLDYAKLGSIYVLRKAQSGQTIRLRFNYKQVIKGHNLAQNVNLESHDTVVVP